MPGGLLGVDHRYDSSSWSYEFGYNLAIGNLVRKVFAYLREDHLISETCSWRRMLRTTWGRRHTVNVVTAGKLRRSHEQWYVATDR